MGASFLPGICWQSSLSPLIAAWLDLKVGMPGNTLPAHPRWVRFPNNANVCRWLCDPENLSPRILAVLEPPKQRHWEGFHQPMTSCPLYIGSDTQLASVRILHVSPSVCTPPGFSARFLARAPAMPLRHRSFWWRMSRRQSRAGLQGRHKLLLVRTHCLVSAPYSEYPRNRPLPWENASRPRLDSRP